MPSGWKSTHQRLRAGAMLRILPDGFMRQSCLQAQVTGCTSIVYRYKSTTFKGVVTGIIEQSYHVPSILDLECRAMETNLSTKACAR